MARPHDIAPCKMKGAGSVQEANFRGCECARSLKCKSGWTSYFVDKNGKLQSFPFNSVTPQATHTVVPCNETYLKRKSPGTELHKKLNPKSTFKGCYDVEKYLLQNGLIRYEPREKIGKSLDPAERSELFGTLADFEGFSADDAFEFLFTGIIKKLGIKDLFSFTLEVDRLQEQLTYEDLEVPTYQVDHEEEQRAEQLAEAINGLLSVLTTKQRNALRAVYLDNYEGHSRAAIARRMGIREDTLNERIHGAFKKLRSLRP
jgi:DNA-directed RNA polymerase specialized sigma24 family protein